MAKPKLLLYLKPEALEVYSDQSQGPARLDFPPPIVNHQEVFDEEKYAQLLENFFSPMGIAELEAVILISSPLVYSKEFPYEQVTTAQDPNKPLLDYNLLNTKIEEFIESAPFDNNQISNINLQGDTSSLVLVTNKMLYQKIIDVFLKLQGRVLSVVPITVLGNLAQKPVLDPDDIEQIFADRKILQSNNFLLSVQSSVAVSATKTISPDDYEDDEEDNGEKKSKFLFIFGIIFILGGLVALGLMMGLIKNPFDKPKVTTTPAANIQTTPQASVVVTTSADSVVQIGSPSALLQEIKKENLKVGITNGSGIVGQGSKVQALLAGLGYKDITINGTKISGVATTSVDFKSNVVTATRDELVKELQKTFLDVKSTEATAGAKYDINIITGSYK